MLASQGYGQRGTIATQGYGAYPIAILVVHELRELGVRFNKTTALDVHFEEINRLSVLMERVIESAVGTIPPGSPPTPTTTIEVRDLIGIFSKARGVAVGRFEVVGKLETIFERIVESHAGDIVPPGGTPDPTPTVEIRELTGIFEKTPSIVVYFDYTGKLRGIFKRSSEDRS